MCSFNLGAEEDRAYSQESTTESEPGQVLKMSVQIVPKSRRTPAVYLMMAEELLFWSLSGAIKSVK